MERYYRAAFSMVPGFGPAKMKELLRCYSSAESAWKTKLSPQSGLGEKMLQVIGEWKSKVQPEKLKEMWEKEHIRVLIPEDDEYPLLLKEIYQPPSLLYIKGSLIGMEKAIAIVGSRKCTSYGRAVAEKFAQELSRNGITVVSGGARGIDTSAHRGALRSGKTVAILGCGVNVVYPPENRVLFSEIVEHGALISEYPPGTPPIGGNFPARNRILSGICQGTLVVEAARNSGSLITAELALEQNREVFSIPGSIYSLSSEGTHRLIQAGAKLVHSPEDVLEDLNIKKSASPTLYNDVSLNDIEQKILSLLVVDAPKSLEKICEAAEISWSEASLVLIEMELKGFVKQEGLQSYVRVMV